jgi:hypothetical protein
MCRWESERERSRVSLVERMGWGCEFEEGWEMEVPGGCLPCSRSDLGLECREGIVVVAARMVAARCLGRPMFDVYEDWLIMKIFSGKGLFRYRRNT